MWVYNMDSLKKNKNLWLLYEKEIPHSRFCDPSVGVSPAEKLSPEHLQLLRNAFTCPKYNPPTQKTCGRRRRNRGTDEEHKLMFEEFCEVIKYVVGPEVEDAWVKRFFNEVDICCTGQVTWQQLCSYLLLEYRERERASIPTAALLDSHQIIRHCSHNKREPTVRVVAVFHPPPLRYFSVSKGGQVTVWNSSLHITKSLGLAGDPTEEVANTRRFRGWVTDAVYMGNVRKVAISTDCRDLHIINVSTTCIFQDLHLYGFPCVPTALCYWYDTQYPYQPSLLLLGDEMGGIHVLQFLNPSKGLFKNMTKKENSLQRIFFPNLSEHESFVSYRHIPSIHQEPINRIMFETSTNVIMTSSESTNTSVVLINMSLKQDPYIWKIREGVKCFDYSASLQLIVTGGCDCAVRLWARYVPTHPVATLLGHRTAVLDVAIYQPVEQIFSYSRDAELRIWDITTHECLKTVSLQFPCLQAVQIPEHGHFPFLLLSSPFPEETQPHLLVGCKDYLALLSLSERQRGGGGGWLTDQSGDARSKVALSCALYNPTLRQVVTGSIDSTVSVWDVKSGKKKLQISNVHGEERLSCMALDSSKKRLITGACNGTIKMWNLLTGLNLHKLQPLTNSEVNGLLCLHSNQLLAVGWSQCIVEYDIASSKDVLVKAKMLWKSGGSYKSDILTVSHCPALEVIATASLNGEVIIWKMETQGPLLHLSKGTYSGALPPVDKLIFLQHRAGTRNLRNKGVLVSSQAGILCFWSITGQTHTYGQFYAPEQSDERILTLSSDQSKNTVLVSGDTAGWLQIWDISHYGLDIQTQAVCERPPLLHCWRAHTRALTCVEVLEVAERLFVLTASADGSAGLWTIHGDHVGSFGQGDLWNITDACTYQTTREPQINLTEAQCDQSQSQSPDLTNSSQTSHREPSAEDSSSGEAEREFKEAQPAMFLNDDCCQMGASWCDRRFLFDDSVSS